MKDLYLARDDDGSHYGIFEGRPEKDQAGDWEEYEAKSACDEIFDFCADEFRTVVGSHPVRPGRIKKIESITFNFKPLK